MNNSFAAPYEPHIATVNVQGNQKDVEPANIIPTSLTSKEDLNNDEHH